MKRRWFAVFLTVTFAAAGLFAHGDKKHVLGTIEKITSGSITVKTRDGKSVEVRLASSTVYVSRVGNFDKAARLSDLAVGENVVIHATPRGDQLEADEVKFSAAGAPSPPAAAKAHP